MKMIIAVTTGTWPCDLTPLAPSPNGYWTRAYPTRLSSHSLDDECRVHTKNFERQVKIDQIKRIVGGVDDVVAAICPHDQARANFDVVESKGSARGLAPLPEGRGRIALARSG